MGNHAGSFRTQQSALAAKENIISSTLTLEETGSDGHRGRASFPHSVCCRMLEDPAPSPSTTSYFRSSWQPETRTPPLAVTYGCRPGLMGSLPLASAPGPQAPSCPQLGPSSSMAMTPQTPGSSFCSLHFQYYPAVPLFYYCSISKLPNPQMGPWASASCLFTIYLIQHPDNCLP